MWVRVSRSFSPLASARREGGREVERGRVSVGGGLGGFGGV